MQGRRHQSTNRSNRGRRPNYRARLVLAGVALVLVFVAIYYISTAAVLGVGTPKYYNVSVNGVALKGYTRQQASQIFNQLTSEWASKQYELTWNGNVWSFTPADFDATLDVETQLTLAWNMGHNGSLSERKRTVESMNKNAYAFNSQLRYSEEKVDAFIESLSSQIDVAPIDAEVVLDVTAPRIITESRTGLKLDTAAAKESVISILTYGSGNSELNVEVLEPAVSSDSMSQGMSVVSSYWTDMTMSSWGRFKNVQRALNNFNCFAVYPGDTISFNQIVGERTAERGYNEAPEYSGTSVVNGYGGGSCQASSTLYCAAIMAGMDIIERHPHNMTVAYAEPSLDATVSWGNKDFIFRNNTGKTMYIYTKVTRKKAWVVIYGNRPEYKVEFKSVLTKRNIAPSKEEIREDTAGQYVKYSDERYIYSEGKPGCESESWLIYSDWETGEEVKRVQVSHDVYYAGTSIIYVGVRDR